MQHLFDALTNRVAFLVEGGELTLVGDLNLLLRGKLGAEIFNFSLGGTAGFTLALDDLDGAKHLLLQRLELVDGDRGCTHNSLKYSRPKRGIPEGMLCGTFAGAWLRFAEALEVHGSFTLSR
ncbi:hypothetical protein BH10ACI4_BH10ACI4_30650 [soil metagenome]